MSDERSRRHESLGDEKSDMSMEYLDKEVIHPRMCNSFIRNAVPEADAGAAGGRSP